MTSSDPPTSPNSAVLRQLIESFSGGGEVQARCEERHFATIDNPQQTQRTTGEREWFLIGHPADVEECKKLATLAAVALGFPSGANAWASWLETLRTYSSHFRDSGGFTLSDVDRGFKAEGRIGTIEKFREASASYCRILWSERQTVELTTAQRRSALGRNIEKLRKECGWTFEEMAVKVGISKDAANDHINHGTQPHAKTLKAYADAFSAALERAITVEELERE